MTRFSSLLQAVFEEIRDNQEDSKVLLQMLADYRDDRLLGMADHPQSNARAKSLVISGLQENFLDYIPKLSSSMGNEPFFLFMDRLSVHRMKTVKEKLQEFGITPIYNCSASPDLNAIETCFAQVKLKYKKNRCIALMHRE